MSYLYNILNLKYPVITQIKNIVNKRIETETFLLLVSVTYKTIIFFLKKIYGFKEYMLLFLSKTSVGKKEFMCKFSN
jgi:hypothetical protein